jgi:hypothetical protein
MSIALLFLLLLPLSSHASVKFTSVFLMDSSAFRAAAFSSLVTNLTNASSCVLHSIEADTITGMAGRRLFVNSSAFYSFQLLHVTRVAASVHSGDDLTASAVIRHSLPHEVALSGIGVMGLEGVEIGVDDINWLTVTYLAVPGFVAQYLLLGWVLTVLLVLCYCCCFCCGKEEVVVPAAVVEEGCGGVKNNAVMGSVEGGKIRKQSPAAVKLNPKQIRRPNP